MHVGTRLTHTRLTWAYATYVHVRRSACISHAKSCAILSLQVIALRRGIVAGQEGGQGGAPRGVDLDRTVMRLNHRVRVWDAEIPCRGLWRALWGPVRPCGGRSPPWRVVVPGCLVRALRGALVLCY